MKKFIGSRALLLDRNKVKVENSHVFIPFEGDAVFKVIYTTICGSDLRIMEFGDPRVKYPRTLGHEIVAKVIDAGLREDIRPGEIVSIGADIPCNSCSFCTRKMSNLCNKHLAVGYQFDGGLADYLIIPKEYLISAPIVSVKPHMSVAAYALSEPLGCVLHGLEYSRVEKHNRLLIFGGGPIGLMIAYTAQKFFEVSSSDILIIEPNESRREFLRRFEIEVVDKIDIRKLDDENKFDRIFTATSNSQSHRSVLEYCRRGAFINFFGGVPRDTPSISLEANLLHYSEICISGSHGSTPRHHELATKMIAKDEFFWDSLITLKISISQFSDVANIMRSGREMKIAVQLGEIS